MKSSSVSHLARGMENLASGTEEAPLRSRGDLLSVVLDVETLGFVTSIFKSWLDPLTVQEKPWLEPSNLLSQPTTHDYASRQGIVSAKEIAIIDLRIGFMVGLMTSSTLTKTKKQLMKNWT
nr:hypothetical protein Iba_chr11dCG9880 [Ipomoea batatas]